MQSTAKTVDDYFLEVPADRLATMRAIRALAQEVFAGFSESMIFGMPCYGQGEAISIGFNSQKHYIAVYLPPPIVAANKDLLGGLDCGKSCLRFKKPEKVDLAILRTLFQKTRDMDARVTRPNLPEG